MGVQKRQASACDASKPGRSTAASKTQPMMFKEAGIPFVRHKEKRNMRRMPLGTCIGADNPDWFELELAGWQQAIKLMEDAVKLGK